MLAGKNAVHFQMQFPNVGSAKSSQTFQLHINKCGLGHVVTNVGSAKSSQTILVTNPSDDLFSVNCSFHKKNAGSAKMGARPSREVNSTCDTAKMWARPKQWARPRQNVGSAKTKSGGKSGGIIRSGRQIREANPRVLGATTHFLACLFSSFILRSPGRPPVGMCTSTPGRAKIAATTIITENIIRFLRESRFLEMGPGVPFSSRSPRAFGPVSARGSAYATFF